MSGSSSYLYPRVKIELGARFGYWPTETPIIEPYLADAFSSILVAVNFRSMQSPRKETFWEKRCLLHEEHPVRDQDQEKLVWRDTIISVVSH